MPTTQRKGERARTRTKGESRKRTTKDRQSGKGAGQARHQSAMAKGEMPRKAESLAGAMRETASATAGAQQKMIRAAQQGTTQVGEAMEKQMEAAKGAFPMWTDVMWAWSPMNMAREWMNLSWRMWNTATSTMRRKE